MRFRSTGAFSRSPTFWLDIRIVRCNVHELRKGLTYKCMGYPQKGYKLTKKSTLRLFVVKYASDMMSHPATRMSQCSQNFISSIPFALSVDQSESFGRPKLMGRADLLGRPCSTSTSSVLFVILRMDRRVSSAPSKNVSTALSRTHPEVDSPAF